MPKRASIQFVGCAEFESLEIKFGGEPYGLPESIWPMSRQTGNPMQFICQIPFGPDLFPGAAKAVAYLFMSAPNDGHETWVPDGGENALVVVSLEKLTATLTVGDAPRLCQMVKKWWSKRLVPRSCVYGAKLTMGEDPCFIPEGTLFQMTASEATSYRKAIEGNKLGGSPGFVQGDELPIAEPWHLLLQLDSTRVPFEINFGDAGIGYAFISGDGTEGKFLWQCC